MELSKKAQAIFEIPDIQRLILDFFGWVYKRNNRYDRLVTRFNKLVQGYRIPIDIQSQQIITNLVNATALLVNHPRKASMARQCWADADQVRINATKTNQGPLVTAHWRPIKKISARTKVVPVGWRESDQINKVHWSPSLLKKGWYDPLRVKVKPVKKYVPCSSVLFLRKHGLRVLSKYLNSMDIEREFYDKNWHRLRKKTFYIFKHTRVVSIDSGATPIEVGGESYKQLIENGYTEVKLNDKKIQRAKKRKIKHIQSKIQRVFGFKPSVSHVGLQIRIKDLGRRHRWVYTQNGGKLHLAKKPLAFTADFKFRQMSASEHFFCWYAKKYAPEVYGHQYILDPVVCALL